MATFHLQIVTPEGLKLDEEVENIILRTINGDVGILKGHIGYVSAIDAGRVKIKQDGTSRYGAASEGFIRVGKDMTTLVATTFEWAEEIDTERAQKSLDKAQSTLNGNSTNGETIDLAKLRQKRATVRIAVAAHK
ncbi:MAG: ATP synthase F1 subunit epsilon [Oscillospiraceae bacterium]